MSIIDLQRRLRKLGNLRLGTKVVGSDNKPRPVKLDTWRITSPDQSLIEQAAHLWGGKPDRWGDEYEVITTTNELPVWVPWQEPTNVSWFEEWGRGGILKRCDGEHDTVRDMACDCDPENRACNPTTRASFCLPDLADIGVWLLSSTGWNAAIELGGTLEMLLRQMDRSGSRMLPGVTLAAEQRESRKQGEQVKKFVVPVLRLRSEMRALVDASSSTVALPEPSGSVLENDSPVVPPPAQAPTAALPPLPHEMEEEQQAAWSETEKAARVPDAKVAAIPNIYDAEAAGDLIPDEPADAWGELLNLLGETPDAGTNDEIERRCRRLYSLMEGVGLWKGDAFHAALKKKYSVQHWSDLRVKANMAEFTRMSFEAAKAKVSNAD